MKPENGFTLVGVIFTMLALVTIGLGLVSIFSSKARGSALDLQGAQALEVANGGLQYILTKDFWWDSDFSDNVSPTSVPYGLNSVALGLGNFWAEYQNLTVDSAEVIITGRVDQSVRQIFQKVSMLLPIGYTIFSGNNVDLNGAGGTANGNIGAEQNIQLDNGFTVTGNVESNVPLTLPTVDFTLLTSLTDSTHSGTLQINGNYSGNVYVNGNVVIRSGSTVTGIIVSDQNIDLDGTVNVTGTLAAVNNLRGDDLGGSTFTSQLGPSGEVLPVLASGNNIDLEIEGGLETIIQGLIQSDQNIRIEAEGDNAQVTISGLLYAGNNVEVTVSDDPGATLTINSDPSLVNLLLGSGNLNLENWKEL